MKNAFLPLVFFVGCLCACKGKARHRVKTDDVTLTEVKADPAPNMGSEPLDSSLVSLKKSHFISLEGLLCQTWSFEDADKEHWKEIFWDPVQDIRQYPELAFFADHSVTANPRCGLETGRWELNKDTRELSLRFTDGTTRSYLIRDLALKQVELGWKKDGGMAVIQLKADGIVHRRVAEDPYYPENSKWRQRPAVSETHAQIGKRIRGYVHFFALFFADNHNRQLTEISFNGLPSCFVWYNGGIGMQTRSSLDKTWIQCFFSEDQAYTAYDMISTQLGRHELKWPEHPTSWVEQTGQVLGQLEEKF